MAFLNPYFDRLTAKQQENTVTEISRVMRGVFGLDQDTSPADVRKLFAMLKPGCSHELEVVTIQPVGLRGE